jgi:carbamate kinase
MSETKRKLAAVAIGGNSLITDKHHPEVEHQVAAVRETCKHLAAMIEEGWDIIVTHGNGPQVGFILRRAELAAHEVHTVPLDVIGADTQGAIGYMLQQALENEFRRRGLDKRAVSVVTQVLVDADDPAFSKPTKGIGGYMDEEKADLFRREGWTVVDDAGRGYRRMVASPQPLEIIELPAIETLVNREYIVISVGGGGIPVIRNAEGALEGTYAVIDKDRATSLLATGVNADLLLISTAVEQVAINFNQPDQQWLDHMTLDEARRYMDEGHFAPGSMKPKIEAVIQFLENGGERALITDPPNIARALAGETGTWITRE